jgi:arsenate reductase
MASAQLEVQIFGVRKSADTRKAQRFFSERRVRAHFVDLMEKPMSEGELRRFVDKFGMDAIVDRDSRRFAELGLHHASLSSSRWFDRLCLEPLLLRLPLVRRLGKPPDLTVGPAEADWKRWLEDSIKP